MPSPIIARADALMHRKRQSGSEFDEVPLLTDSINDDDDIPVLTDIDPRLLNDDIPASAEASPEPGELAFQESSPQQDVIAAARRDQLVQELTSRIEERIKAVLPQIISSTVSEFLAEQEMIAND